jgi:RNA polymerase sigma factor (sigma-70 family)
MDEKPHKPSGAPDSFSSLIGSPELRAKLISLARFRRIPTDDCEDIASEAIARAVSKQEEYDPNRGSFFSWAKAITENVICSYYRKRNAQKRKAQGGMISLNTAAIELDREGARDAFQRQRDSEELEHLIATTKLSEKERKAIAHQRYQGNEQNEAPISRSTARRAREKVKQTKSNEEFGKSPGGPDAFECAYGKIPRAEHNAALFYDQLRRTSWFVNAIDCWRKSPEWNDVQAYLENERAVKRFPLIILRQHWPEQLNRYRDAAQEQDRDLCHRFTTAVDIALGFPEWPRVGYCQLAPNERRQRLEQFGWRFGRQPFWEINERTLEVFVNAADEKQKPPRGLAGFLKFVNEAPSTGSHVYSSTHLIRIDWRFPLKTTVGSFKKWAEKERKRTSEKMTQWGRPRTTRLVGFACIRLMEDFGLTKTQAMSWLKERFGAPVPSSPEKLERAVRATREASKHFLPFPAEIGV